MADIVIIKDKSQFGKATIYAENKYGKNFMLQLWETWVDISVPNEFVEETVLEIKKIDKTIVVEVR